MDLITKVLPILWAIVEKKKNCAINISTIDDRLTINILTGRRRKKFVHSLDDSLLINQLSHFLAA